MAILYFVFIEFIRKYHSDPVSTIALFGEVSKREAEQVWKEHKSVRKSLLSLEGKKKKRKFCIECVLLIILIIGLIIIYGKIDKFLTLWKCSELIYHAFY